MKKTIIIISIFTIILLHQGCSIFQSKFTKAKYELVEKIVANPDSIEKYCRESIILTENFLKKIQDNKSRQRVIDEINSVRNDKYEVKKEEISQIWDRNLNLYKNRSKIFVDSDIYCHILVFTFYKQNENWELFSIERYIDTFID